MTKTPPEQRTFTEWHNPDLPPESNFRQLTTFFSDYARGMQITHTRCLSKKIFSYVARLTKTAVGELIWLKTDAFSITAHRNAPNDKLISLIMCLTGRLVTTNDSVSQTLNPGFFTIGNAERSSTLTVTEQSELVILTVNQDYFFTHSGFHSPTFVGALFSCESPVQRFFARQLKSIARDAGNLDARDVGNVCDGIFCFLRPVLSEFNRASLSEASGPRTRDELRTAAYEIMQKFYKQPDLSVAGIAEKIGISERYLSSLFRDNGITVMKALYDIRVRRASVILREEHTKTLSVKEIARLNGFKSATHFCRQFRSHFHMTPLDWRRTYLN